MTDTRKPKSLARITEDAGFTMADVACVSGLDESTVCRLWDDPQWLDRASGKSLQFLAASVPGVAEYFAEHSVAVRQEQIIEALEAEGLVVNRAALVTSAAEGVPHQFLINALGAALSIMRGDARKAAARLARFWGLQQDRALVALYSTGRGTSLLRNPEELLTTSLALVPRMASKNYSLTSILAQAAVAHHIGISAGDLIFGPLPRITDRQSAFTARSTVMGLLISTSDLDLAQMYGSLVEEVPVLAMIEEWSFPTYTRDCRPNSDFTLPGSLLLRNTAEEVIREMSSYAEAYIYYLAMTYIPSALQRDATFGLRTCDLESALLNRCEVLEDVTVRKECADLAARL
jgi:hypothetical protein